MPFDLQPTLQGSLVTLRPLRPDDFDAVFASASDPLIWKQHPEPDRYKRDVFERYFEGALNSGGAFAVLDRRTGRIIGSTRFNGYDEAKSEIEIGWTFLERGYWGGVYNREMKTLLLDHAFKFVERVVFVVGQHNVRSQRAMERIGARREGTRPDARGLTSLVFVMTAASRTSQAGATENCKPTTANQEPET